MSSSISSSRSEAKKPGPRRDRGGKRKKRLTGRPVAGLVGFVVLLVLAELFVFRNLYVYGHSPGFVGQLGELKASFDRYGGERAKVAIFGDSQSMDALLPEKLAAGGPYEANEIFNFSLSGGSAFDMEKTYRAYRDRLPNLEKAFVIVNEHQFNEARTVADIKFKYYAGLRERFQVMDTDNYGDLLLGWLLKSYDLRTVWTMMIEKYRKGELRESVPAHPGGLPPVTWSPRTSRTPEYAAETADRWFDQFSMGGLRSQSFEKLIRDLREQGVEVVILQLPRSDWFEQAVRAKYAEEQDRYFAFVRAVAERYDAECAVIPNDELEMDRHFRDTNHVNPAGAEWVSRYVAERWLRP